ncbi:MAG TPA: sulfatase [Tepidisphaeraceae bacterium]|nr:sulfatase [Tepidisphaeraceae bacterium]
MRQLLIVFTVLLLARVARAATTPNVVLIFMDDQGYADVGPFGGKTPTPNIDRMAQEGMRFTRFHAGQPICSASRAALMTGCYPNRVGIFGALGPKSKTGISDREMTMGQMFKSRGYATMIIGKWHLGDAPQFLPTRHGFDQWYGLPYSNDMRPKSINGNNYPDLPLYENEKVIARNPDQSQLTTNYTEHAVSFIEQNKDHPFFLYLAHSMPHVPLHVSDKFKDKSGHGLYGDVTMEIDWSVGQVLDALKRLKLDENTLVVYTSDNGPWLLYGDHAGKADPYREGKMTSFEGGSVEPCIMRWPGQIPAGKTCEQLAVTFDLLPTFAKLVGAELPTDRKIDGRDIWPLMHGDADAKSPHDVFYHYWSHDLQAVESGRWKLHFAHNYIHPDPPGHGGAPGKTSKPELPMSLFDLEADHGETKDVSADHPDIVKRLTALAEVAREDLGDAATKREGKNVREPGRLTTQPSSR